jgi:D-inositol-3-phosphate glycosyltransferase
VKTHELSRSTEQRQIEVGVLTGGFDRPYAFGLTTALAAHGVTLDVIGSDEIERPEMHTTLRLRFLNLQGRRLAGLSPVAKLWRVLVYYARLVRYAAIARPRIFHILWNNKFPLFDRTILMLYYKLLGKQVVFTAHNVNAGQRDSNDSLVNRLSLRVQYRLADHIFVHTDEMKQQLADSFRVPPGAITVIPFGVNNSVPDTALTGPEARRRLGIAADERIILFFGNIGAYKGLDLLVDAFQRLCATHPAYRLIVAGLPRHGWEGYWTGVHQAIEAHTSRARITLRIEYVPDHETEHYFKAADVLVLPYRHVFQSGVLFLSYSFGLPVIATDIASLREDIVEGHTGFLCKPDDPVDMARVIERYFESDLFRQLPARRQRIREYVRETHSWDVVAGITANVYAGLAAAR